MPADATLRVNVRPVIDSSVLLAVEELGQKAIEVGQAFLRLAALLAPDEGETVDSMTVHYPMDND